MGPKMCPDDTPILHFKRWLYLELPPYEMNMTTAAKRLTR